MSRLLVAFLFGIGSGGWIYSKVSRLTGNQYKTSITVAVVCGLILMFIVYTVTSSFLH